MLLFFATQIALAGIPLVHEGGDPAALTAEASSKSGLPADQLDAIDIAKLRDHPPQSLGQIAVRRCAREATQNSGVRAELVRAEAALGADDLIGAADHLDLAVSALSCLTEVVESAVAARTFLLRGALSAEEGREEDARGEIRTALAFDSKVNWPPGYPVSGQSLVVEEIENAVRHPVAAVPDPGLGPWIDGTEVADTTQLTEGLHLFQHSSPKGIRSAWLVVAGPGTVVVPEKFQAPVLDAFLDAETRSDLEYLLNATIEDFEAAYVTHMHGLWLVVANPNGPSTSELTAAVIPEPEPLPEPLKKKGKKH